MIEKVLTKRLLTKKIFEVKNNIRQTRFKIEIKKKSKSKNKKSKYFEDINNNINRETIINSFLIKK